MGNYKGPLYAPKIQADTMEITYTKTSSSVHLDAKAPNLKIPNIFQ